MMTTDYIDLYDTPTDQKQKCTNKRTDKHCTDYMLALFARENMANCKMKAIQKCVGLSLPLLGIRDVETLTCLPAVSRKLSKTSHEGS